MGLGEIVCCDLVMHVEALEDGGEDTVQGTVEQKWPLWRPNLEHACDLEGVRLLPAREHPLGAGISMEVVVDPGLDARAVGAEVADGVVHEDVEERLEFVRDLDRFGDVVEEIYGHVLVSSLYAPVSRIRMTSKKFKDEPCVLPVSLSTPLPLCRWVLQAPSR